MAYLLIASQDGVAGPSVPAADIDSAPRYLAVERLLETETDAMVRADLVIRWFELKLKHIQPGEEAALYEKLIQEDEVLRAKAGEGGQKISRILAWHFFERKKFAEASKHFQRITDLNSRERLAFGDSYLNQGLLALAIAEYEKAMKDLEAPASYRMGWAYLQFQDDERALSYFDRALAAKPTEGFDVAPAAFRERVVPWLRLKTSDSLTEADLKALDEMALKIFPTAAPDEMAAMHQKLMDACFGKDFIQSAELVYRTMLSRSSSPEDFALTSAPRWVRTYRARMNYEAVQNVLLSMSATQLDEAQHGDLRDEVFNTIDAYERIIDTDPSQVALKSYLKSLYAQSFLWFPSAARFEKSRVNEAKMYLDSGDSELCLMRLQTPSADAGIEGSRVLLLRRCQLHQLQAMISAEKYDQAIQLSADLLVHQKAFSVFPAEETEGVRDQLGRAFLSLIEKRPVQTVVLDALKSLTQVSPWPDAHPLKAEMQRAYENIQLREIVAQSAEGVEKTSALRKFLASAQLDDVKLKSLSNVALLESGQERLKACQEISRFRPTMKVEDSVDAICVESFRDQLDVENLRVWLSNSENRSVEKEILLGMAEVSLGHIQGEARLKKNGQGALIELLKAPAVQVVGSQKSVDEFSFEPGLAEIKNPIQSLVKKLKAFEKIDGSLARASKNSTSAELLQRSLDQFVISDRFIQWMNKLSQNITIEESQRASFHAQLAQLVQFWTAERETRRLSYCDSFFQLNPFSDAEAKVCEGPSNEWIQKDFESWSTDVRDLATLAEKDRQRRDQYSQVKEAHRRTFGRLVMLAGSSSSEFRAVVLQDWALEDRRSDLLNLALSQKPRSLEFYRVSGSVLNPLYQGSYQKRLEHLEKIPPTSASIN
jgi:tetratricopeptide (TPR) repeat protein